MMLIDDSNDDLIARSVFALHKQFNNENKVSEDFKKSFIQQQDNSKQNYQENLLWRRKNISHIQQTGIDGRADRSYRDPKNVASISKNLLKDRGWEKSQAIAKITNSWEEIVGKKTAEHTTPVHFDDTQGELVINCDSTPWATQLRLLENTMLDSIRTKIQSDIITSLKIMGPYIPREKYGRLRIKGRGPRDDFG